MASANMSYSPWEQFEVKSKKNHDKNGNRQNLKNIEIFNMS